MILGLLINKVEFDEETKYTWCQCVQAILYHKAIENMDKKKEQKDVAVKTSKSQGARQTDIV